MKLYFAPGTCALAVHIALQDIGCEYETIQLDFGAAEQTGSDYLAINPKGRVPALITDDGVLTETPAILAFLAQRYPEAGLAPLNDAFGFARAQEFNSYLCSTVHVAHAHLSRGSRWADDPAAIAEMTRKVPESVLKAFQLIEDGMLQGPWVLGDSYSMCDGYLFTVARWLERDSIDPETALPRVADHRRRMMDRDSVKAVIGLHSRSR